MYKSKNILWGYQKIWKCMTCSLKLYRPGSPIKTGRFSNIDMKVSLYPPNISAHGRLCWWEGGESENIREGVGTLGCVASWWIFLLWDRPGTRHARLARHQLSRGRWISHGSGSQTSPSSLCCSEPWRSETTTVRWSSVKDRHNHNILQ